MSTDGFVLSANLPENDVTLCVCSDRTAANALEKLGIKTVDTLPSPFLADEVSTHPDMQLCHLGGKLIIADKFQTNVIQKLKEIGFNILTDNSPNNSYPDDIRFNAAVCGGAIFGRTDKLSPILKTAAARLGITGVYVKQGYAKCSVCIVNTKAVITDDTGIAAAAEKLGIDVLVTEKGDITLSGSHYGFIGGCSGKISKDTIAFTGTLDSHRDGDKIRMFLKKHGCRPYELSDNNLKDVGGILPIKEAKDVFTRN